jgi:hypothetical protein
MIDATDLLRSPRILCLSALVLACSSSRPPVARGGGPAPATVSAGDASMAWAAAACDRSDRCDRFEVGDSATQCRASESHLAMHDLDDCTSQRVDAARLRTCLESLRAAPCGPGARAVCSPMDACAR